MNGRHGESGAARELGLELRQLEGGTSRTSGVLNKLDQVNDRYEANASEKSTDRDFEIYPPNRQLGSCHSCERWIDA